MGDVWSNPTIDQARELGSDTPEAAPPVGVLESIGLGFKRGGAAPDWGLNQINYEGRALAAIEAEARRRGTWQAGSKARTREDALAYARSRSLGEVEAERISSLLAWYQNERRSDPRLLPEYAAIADRKTLRAFALERRRQDMAQADAALQGGSGVAAFIGELGHGLVDPTSYIPVGGQAARGLSVARQILSTAAREAAANVAFTVASEPLVRRDAAALGIDRDMGDFLFDIGVSGTAGAGIGAAAKGLQLGAPRASAAARAAFDQLPEALRLRWRDAGTEADRQALDALDAALPEDLRTPDEQAAARVVERSAEVAEASPFHPTPPGDDAHAARLDHWLDAITADAPVTRGTSPPPTVTRSQVAAGAAPAGSLRMPARAQLKARIRRAESGGNDRAENGDSSASGRYQFTFGTWLGYYKRRYGGKEGNNAIWAKRFDGDLQEVLMDDLVADNARMLRDAGQPETAGTLYLLHFAGPDGLKVLRAAPDTPVEKLLSASAIASNKTKSGRQWLRGMTAADLIAWADRKMGAPGETTPRAGDVAAAVDEAPVLREEDDVEIGMGDHAPAKDWLAIDDMPQLRAELFGTPEEHARAQLGVWRERDAADGFASIVEDPAPAGPAIEVRNKAPSRRSGPADVMRVIAEAGGLLDNEGHDLVKGRGIPKFMLGAGSIVRPNGTPGARGIDAIGEVLWEQGFFGPPSTTPRPRESEIIELVERGSREKVYRPEEQAEADELAARRAAPDEDEVVWELNETAREFGVELDPVTLEDALMRRARGTPVDDAVLEAVEAARYRDTAPAAGLERFDDPDGEAAAAQMASIEHDLRMLLVEQSMVGQLPVRGLAPANIAEDGRIYVGREGGSHFEVMEQHSEAGPWTGATGFVTPDGTFLDRAQALEWVTANEKKIRPAANMGAELDALDYRDQVVTRRGRSESSETRGREPPVPEAFRVDVEGDPAPLAAILAELDDDIAATDVLRSCMAPAAEAAE